jgi:hypothetical protein
MSTLHVLVVGGADGGGGDRLVDPGRAGDGGAVDR